METNPPVILSEVSNIKNWPAGERPRERLFREGVGVLSDAELIALLLRNGIRGKDAVNFARELLSGFHGLRGLLSAETGKLVKIKGLGHAKIASLLAASELARRQLREEILGKDFVRDPESVVSYLYACLRDRKREVLKVLFLNKANRILGEEDLFQGTVDEAAIHPREVVKAALDRYATGVVLVHNHPSGRIEPSAEDKIITLKLQTACNAVSIKVLDHIIVGDNRYFSFVEHGCMP